MMSDVKRIRLPLSEEDVLSLRAGDQVLLDGEVTITAGLPTHRRLLDCLEGKEALPFDLGGSLLHLGGYSEEADDGEFRLLYLNPTTSTRFNDYMPRLIGGLGLRVVGGKGGLDQRSVDAMRAQGCVYLSFLGGGCTLLSQAIRKVIAVGWPEMLIHYRLTRVSVAGLGPCTVAIDAHGRSLYAEGAASAHDRMPEILRALDADRSNASK